MATRRVSPSNKRGQQGSGGYVAPSAAQIAAAKSQLGPAPGTPARPKPPAPGTPITGDPNNPFAGMTAAQIAAWLQAQAAALAGSTGSSSSSGVSAADLAEKKREFDITTQRDISKENATEVDALQKMLAGLSGPKDVYADLFFSHGLNTPQGYAPAPVPLTQAQKDAYSAMGVTPQQLQQMIIGNGKPGADTGMLGSLGSSLQTPAGLPQFTQAQAPTTPQVASNPTVMGGQLYGKAPAGTTIAGNAAPQPPTTPGGVPSMAVGGQVPGPPMTPKLAVVHGGEQVTPAPQSEAPDDSTSGGVTSIPSLKPQATSGSSDMSGAMTSPGLHPAIAALVDAVSNLISNPDFRPFVEAAEQTNQATPGGVQSMATGGTVTPGPTSGGLTPSQSLSYQQTGINPTTQPSAAPSMPRPGSTVSPPPGGTNPRGIPTVGAAPAPVLGTPQAGAQGVLSNSGTSTPIANPVLALNKMDPYTRALYDIHGRLHPYSAQQEAQMGPQGITAVNSYIGKVLGGDVNAYTDLANRLKPIGAAPTASTGTASEGFGFG